jgi:hypothetical protein
VDIQPQDLVRFGSSYLVSAQPVRLAAMPGPSLALRWGTLALADPWFPEMLPEFQVIGLGQGEKPTLLSTIDVQRGGEAQTIACAAMIGPVDEVVTWRPLVQGEAHFHLDSDSALGAFYDITDAASLRPLFEDDQHMQAVYNRALEEQVVTMDVDGRVAAVVFLCPDGSGLYPVYAGFDKDMQAVAVLVDLKLLDGAPTI